MDITITTGSTANLIIPINLLFWAYVAAYVVHILEESVLGENFVEMVKRNFFPDYEWHHFFAFNTVLMSAIVLSIILYEAFGGRWLILPLAFVFQMVTNGLWHLGATILSKRYSPGLLTSILYWMLFYFIVRYSFMKGQIPASYFYAAAFAGAMITAAMIGSMFGLRKKFEPER